MIDVHVHLAALPAEGNGCWISPKMRRSLFVRYVLYKLGGGRASDAEINRIYVDRLVGHLRSSTHVQKAVLLALDGVYDAQGNWDKARTNFLISNDYLLGVVRRFPDLFLPGVSINPQRRGALDEVERYAQAGAVLVKVLPNAQGFDPGNPAYIPYYKALAKHGIAFLCHVGCEFSVKSGHQDYGDPASLRLPLEQGVKVIAAHGMSHGLFVYEKHWKTFQEFVRRYPNFYWDVSALTSPNRVGMLMRLRRHPELLERMVFGSDYPVPVFAYPALLSGQWRDYGRLRQIKNPFDRQYELLKVLGFPDAVVSSLHVCSD